MGLGVIGQALDEGALIELCWDADGILAKRAPMTAGVIDRLERCKIISHYGIGYDHIDVDAASWNGIMMTNVPDYCTDEVSDHTIAMVLMFARGISHSARVAGTDKWTLDSLPKPKSLRGRICELVGLGQIGITVARKAQALGMGVLSYSSNLNEFTLEGTGITPTLLETLFRQSDFISLHAPLNVTTRHLINRETLAEMKPTTTIINTSRGGIIDEDALIDALNSGALNGAGLDVLESEGAITPMRLALVNHPKAVATAHTA